MLMMTMMMMMEVVNCGRTSVTFDTHSLLNFITKPRKRHLIILKFNKMIKKVLRSHHKSQSSHGNPESFG